MNPTVELVIDIVSGFSLLLGSVVVLTTGIGLLRLPTFYTRIHAASITDSLGAGAILFGLALQSGWQMPTVTLKLALILVFLVLTGPAAAHALAKAAYLHGVKPALPPDARHREDDA